MADAMKRTVLRIGGTDRESFLQGLVTNDVGRLSDGPVYAALLTPQGKYLCDFFLLADGDTILLDAPAGRAADLMKRLSMYKLRADVTIEETDLHVAQGTGPTPAGAVVDPRDPALGWRAYGTDEGGIAPEDWTALRVERGVPEADIELVPGETLILEAGFERLNGVDFRKGCFVGQEVVARMKHKTELQKGIVRVAVEGTAPMGTPIEADGKTVGTLYSQSGGAGLAHLRFRRAAEEMTAAGAVVRLEASPA